MSSPHQSFEWLFVEESEGDATNWPPSVGEDSKDRGHVSAQKQPPSHHFYALLVGTTLIYGLAVYLLWQQTERRLVSLARELAALRTEVLSSQHQAAATPRRQDPAGLSPALAPLQSGKPQPQWQAIITGLHLYLEREHGHHPNWQQAEVYLVRRHLAQSRSIDLVQSVFTAATAEQSDLLLYPPIADEVADPLIEFMLETYGYARLPALLAAFETHTTWETLTPVVFGLSAREFEEKWHAYLAAHYPQGQE